jgi:hypothetical protein
MNTSGRARHLARLEADYWSGVFDGATARAAPHRSDPAVKAARARVRTSPRPATEAELDARPMTLFDAVEATERRKRPRDPRYAGNLCPRGNRPATSDSLGHRWRRPGGACRQGAAGPSDFWARI